MIIVLKKNIHAQDIEAIMAQIKQLQLTATFIQDGSRRAIGLVTSNKPINPDSFQAMEGVAEVIPLSTPYLLAHRAFHPENSQIQVGREVIGGKDLAILAGPCAVEGEEQIIQLAQRLKAAGANILRGGAFKPRTSPYSFQGLGLEGLAYLEKARQETGLPICTELMSTDYLDDFVQKVDIIQIGARNMQNYDLLKAVGQTQTPVLLKRGLAATYEEWLLAAEYIMAEGNPHVILCERGIRTFENETRNCLDIQAVAFIKKHSHLPIIIDPSHAAGKTDYIPASSRAAIAAGADGLIIESHHNPPAAWSDGEQSLSPEEFDSLMAEVKKIAPAMDRSLAGLDEEEA